MGDRFGSQQGNSATLRESADGLDIVETIRDLEQEMIEAADRLEFEKAALLRDQVSELKNLSEEAEEEFPKPSGVTYLTKRKSRRRT